MQIFLRGFGSYKLGSQIPRKHLLISSDAPDVFSPFNTPNGKKKNKKKKKTLIFATLYLIVLGGVCFLWSSIIVPFSLFLALNFQTDIAGC